MDANELIAAKAAALKRQGYKGLSDNELNDLAYSEVVAEMMETALTDTDAMERISARLARDTIRSSEEALNAFADAAGDAVVNYRLQDGQKIMPRRARGSALERISNFEVGAHGAVVFQMPVSDKHNHNVVLPLEDGTAVTVPLEEYRQEVFRFADRVEGYYRQCAPKQLPEAQRILQSIRRKHGRGVAGNGITVVIVHRLNSQAQFIQNGAYFRGLGNGCRRPCFGCLLMQGVPFQEVNHMGKYRACNIVEQAR